MQAETIMLFCPTSFFLGYRKKESNSKRKRAVDCAGNNFLHGQKSTIAQLLSTLLEYQVCAFLHTGTTLNLAWKKKRLQFILSTNQLQHSCMKNWFIKQPGYLTWLNGR